MTLNTLLICLITGIIPAMIVDLRTFRDNRKADKTVTFDWPLALSNWAIGAVTGIATAAGISLTSLG